jgi:hypothetical protein
MYTKINNSIVTLLLAALFGPAGFSSYLSAQTFRPSTQKEIRVFDPINPANGNIGLRVASGTQSYTMVLPSTLPAANQLLAVNTITSGIATLRWVTSTTGTGTGANGQVTFWSGTNSLSGSNNLFWDASSGSLGIGTTTPAPNKLSINEATNADLNVAMTARGADNKIVQLTVGVKNASSSTIGGAMGSDGGRNGGLILNGTTNNIGTSAPQVYISPAGELYVNPNFTGGGTLTDNGNYRVQINGDLYATSARFTNVSNSGYFRSLSVTNDGTLTTSTSDRRMKKNIETISHALEKVMALRGVTYNWKDSTMPKRMMGMIAQEVLPVVPELVFQNEKDGYYGINYGESAGLLIEAIKEQQKVIQELSRSLSKQGQEMQVLIKEVSALKQQLKTKL